MTAVLHSKGYTGNTVLYMAMESSNSKWKLGFSNGNRDRIVPIDAGNKSRAVFDPAVCLPGGAESVHILFISRSA
uniref:Uncharacterized protein n=1 Tax=Candidatus Kentrum sp. LFY TaxID=2126342 RepID=A0A450VCC7_9GAMM|nr:MAG: hypothetical protein BECKLFY1418A_GA0070994_11961 [Candidatus Kentron sp. LFY]